MKVEQQLQSVTQSTLYSAYCELTYIGNIV